MAGLSIPEVVPLKAPQGVHLLLAVGLPTLFVVAAQWWLSGQGPSWPQAPAGLIYTVLLAFWAPWSQRSRQGSFLKLWIWLVATLGLWAALAGFDGLPWPHTFAPEGRHLIWFGVGFAQGQLAVLWAGQLAPRARLFQLIEGVPEGRDLEERVRDFQLDADFSKANQAALSASLATMAVVAVWLAASPQGTPAFSAALLVVFLTVCLLVGVLLRTYRREMEALMYGRRYSLADKWMPLAWSSVLALVAALGAWALLGLGGPWFDPSRLHPAPDSPPAPPVIPPPRLPSEALPDGDFRLVILLTLLGLIFEVRRIALAFALVFQTVWWALPWVGAGLLLWPLVRWFLSGGRETRGLVRRWVALLRAQVLAFGQALLAWWRGAADSGSGLGLGSSGAREWLRSFLGRRASGRRKPYPEVIEAFLRLARWAEPVIVYRRGETTREYLDRLADLMDDQGADLTAIRDLLDQELFGPRGLALAQRKAFLGLVASVTSSPASHGPPPEVS